MSDNEQETPVDPVDPADEERTERWRELPPRVEATHAEHPDPSVPGSIREAPDTDQEFFIRHAGLG